MIPPAARRFLGSARVARLGTADASGVPHVVPVCFVLDDATLYVTVDEKPKRADRPLKRVRNIMENPRAVLLVDRYDEDWSRLGWVMLRGSAEILRGGSEHDHAQSLLRDRYVQYRAMDLAPLPVIVLRVTRVTSWGDLGG